MEVLEIKQGIKDVRTKISKVSLMPPDGCVYRMATGPISLESSDQGALRLPVQAHFMLSSENRRMHTVNFKKQVEDGQVRIEEEEFEDEKKKTEDNIASLLKRIGTQEIDVQTFNVNLQQTQSKPNLEVQRSPSFILDGLLLKNQNSGHELKSVESS